MIKVAFNIHPLKSAHKFRGVGKYTSELLKNLKYREDVEILEFQDIKDAEKSDLVHFPFFDLFFHTLPNKFPKPAVVTIHDVIPLVFPKQHPVGIRGKINFFLQKRALKKCRAIITDSENSEKDIIKYLKINESKIDVIPLAADNDFRVYSDSENFRMKRKYNLPDQFLLFVGDCNFEKNLPFLIKGFKALKDLGFEDLKLILINGVFLKKVENIDHPELEPLKKVNQLIKDYDLSNEVLRYGQLEVEDLVGFYNLATVYVQPSNYEGFGLPVLEAMKCGCPVACSNTSSLPEVGGAAVSYFDPANRKQFIEAITSLLQDKSLRNKLSSLGIIQAEKFSWTKTVDETIKVYLKVIKNGV